MNFKESNLFGSNVVDKSNDLVVESNVNEHGKRKQGAKFKLEEKDPNKMFKEPVHVGDCPLCGGAVYSENDPSDDPSMSERCCKCTWWQNQYLTWEEMNEMIDEIESKKKDLLVEDEFMKRYNEDYLNIISDLDIDFHTTETTVHSSKDFIEDFLVNKLVESGMNVNSIDLGKENEFKTISEFNNSLFGLSELRTLIGDDSVCLLCKCIAKDDSTKDWEKIEVLDIYNYSDKPSSTAGIRYMIMDLVELSMMEESGIKIIISSDLFSKVASSSI